MRRHDLIKAFKRGASWQTSDSKIKRCVLRGDVCVYFLFFILLCVLLFVVYNMLHYTTVCVCVYTLLYVYSV